MNFPSAKRTSMFVFFLLFALVAVVTMTAFPLSVGVPTSVHAAPKLAAPIHNEQLAFEPNHGQSPSQVQFTSRAHNYTVFLDSHEAPVVFQAASQPPIPQNAPVKNGGAPIDFVSLHLLEANRAPVPQVEELLSAKA